MDLYDQFMRPDHRGAKSKPRAKAREPHYALEHARQFGDFKCLQCALSVTADPLISGVNNRNHCPYCLWSKHVDLREPGDRLAACKGAMQPVGLAHKRQHKKYATTEPGELMLVHHCTGCGALSINRIAADDFPALLWEVYEASLAQAAALQSIAQPAGIDVLAASARELVRARLFGRCE